MELSRAMLAASASVLGILFYVTAGLLLLLALVTWFHADPNGVGASGAVLASVAFMASGFACRRLARRFS
jgi:hypothetical protein